MSDFPLAVAPAAAAGAINVGSPKKLKQGSSNQNPGPKPGPKANHRDAGQNNDPVVKSLRF